MPKNQSSHPPTSVKPNKPYPDFPLYAHSNGTWAKRIRGRIHYFGRWDDPDGALAKYLDRKDALHAGLTPRPDARRLTVKDACNAFLNHKKAKLDAGALSIRTWAKYKEVTDLLIGEFGKNRLVADLRAEDFASLRNSMAKRWGPLRLADVIQHVRSVFKYAYDAELIDRPVRFGPGFERPSAKVLRLHRASQGPKLFTREELLKLLGVAGVSLKAEILLGMNCGFGNADCGTLPLTALDLDKGMIDFPRPKTGVNRRCPLWPETVAAIKEVMAKRPKPKANAALVFLSERGTPVCSVREGNRTDGIAVQFGALLKRLGINGRKGLGFYTLRHVFRTVADETKDQPAVDFIMGHIDGSMASASRETISDARLRAITDHVRGWLFGEAKPQEPTAEEE